jgi:biofilm PGA synthesis protein PgaA
MASSVIGRRLRVHLRIACLLALSGPFAATVAAAVSPARDALMASARQEREAGHRVDALARCQAVLERWPDDTEAQALNVTLLMELGATTLAQELTARLPRPLSPAQRSRLDADEVAHEIRWAHGDPADPGHPYAEADRAVADARRLADDPCMDRATRQRAELDLLVALDRAGLADEAVTRYDALRERHVALPPYVERAVADALLTRRRPAEAVALYEEAIARDPGPYDAAESEPRIGLMYAYLESGRIDDAIRTIDALVASEPTWIRVPGIRQPVENPRRVDADLDAAALRAYIDMPAQAYARLAAMTREAPAQAPIRRELARVELARGWPRRAEDDFDIAGTLDRRDAGVYLGKAETARVLDDYASVDDDLAMARNMAARDDRVARALRAWDRARGWQVDIATEQGKGSSPDFGDRDATTQATVASPLIDDHWRVLALARYATADLPEGDVRRSRAGVGVIGYARGLEAYIRLLPATDRYVGRTAVEAGVDWAIDDHWAWSTEASTAGDDAPLRGQYYGISARTLDTAVTWKASELTQARVGLSRDGFSDGNQRRAWTATLIQRLHKAPNLALDGGIELGGSMNSRTDRPYFNPRRDNSYALTARLQNLLGQVYERSVTQRVDIAVGQYAQQGYATDWMATVGYGQTYQARAGLRLGWDIAWHDQPYDGRREHRVVLDLTMHWGE